MFMHKSKKGFTIVELVIVIAVIAILAAVLIPTFSNLVKKANQSADIQAVRQMNTILAAEDAYKGGLTINDAAAALNEAGLNGDDYVALVNGRYFFYDQNENRIVYTEYNNGNYDVVFPEDFDTTGHNLLSLSGDVAKKAYAAPTIDATAGTITVAISSAEEFAQLSADVKTITDGKSVDTLPGFTAKTLTGTKIAGVKASNAIVINLTQDIDLKGASYNLSLDNTDFVLNGNGHTISGVVNNSNFAISDNNDAGVASPYGGAFIGNAVNSNITFNDVTFNNCHFGNDSVKGSAVFVGQLYNGSTLTLNNTHVVDCTVSGSKGVGVYVGHIQASEKVEIVFNRTNTLDAELKATSTAAEDVGLVGILAGRVSAYETTPKVEITGTPEISNIAITSAGNTVANAATRWIANASENLGDKIVTNYNGTWSIN